MTKLEALLKESIYNAPLTLLKYKDPIAVQYIDSHLPYSTGFEIECEMKTSYTKEDFTSIPDIMAVDVDGAEQRYRIPPGLRGLICLYRISNALIKNSKLNLGSGIHYHVNMSDWFRKTNITNLANNNREWICKELDLWEYKGKYNLRGVCPFGGHKWARFSIDHKTLEFRCGEMTFDYSVLVKRIIHANDIVRRLKQNAIITEKQKIINQNKALTEILKTPSEIKVQNPIDMDEFVKRRIK